MKTILTGMKQFWKTFSSKPKSYQLITYLAGPMEHTADNGFGWRSEYKKDLQKLHILSVIPSDYETELIPDPEQFQRDKQFFLNRFLKTMRAIIKLDLKFVETVDFVITRWEGERCSGTIGEAQHAFLIGKPNYLVTSKPFHEVPGWFLACFTELFHTKEELYKFLKAEYKR